MLSLFRTNQLLLSFLLLFYAGLLRLSVFIAPDNWTPGPHGIWSGMVYDLIGYQGIVPDLLAILLLFIQGAALNGLNLNHRLTDEVSLFPGLFYILIASLFPDFLHLSPLHLANTFYILALVELMKIYNNKRSSGAIFNAGLWAGIGSLFYFSHLILILVAFSGLAILRAFDLRERLMVVSGAVVPYVLSSLLFFWQDRLSAFFSLQFSENVQLLDFDFVSGSHYPFIKLAIFGLLLLIVLFSHSQYLQKQSIQVQKKVNLLFWGLALSIVTLFFQADIRLEHLLLLSVPLGFLLSINFIRMSRTWAELLHLILLLAAFFFQYQDWVWQF